MQHILFLTIELHTSHTSFIHSWVHTSVYYFPKNLGNFFKWGEIPPFFHISKNSAIYFPHDFQKFWHEYREFCYRLTEILEISLVWLQTFSNGGNSPSHFSQISKTPPIYFPISQNKIINTGPYSRQRSLISNHQHISQLREITFSISTNDLHRSVNHQPDSTHHRHFTKIVKYCLKNSCKTWSLPLNINIIKKTWTVDCQPDPTYTPIRLIQTTDTNTKYYFSHSYFFLNFGDTDGKYIFSASYFFSTFRRRRRFESRVGKKLWLGRSKGEIVMFLWFVRKVAFHDSWGPRHGNAI